MYEQAFHGVYMVCFETWSSKFEKMGLKIFVFHIVSDEEMKEAVEVDKKWSQKMESSKKSSIQNVTDLIEQVIVKIFTHFAFFL